MQQLYRSTSAWFEDREAFEKKYYRPAEAMVQRVMGKLDDPSYEEEVQAHFRTLSERYFNYRGATSISRHIKLFRRFLTKFTEEGVGSLEPVIGWEKRHG